MANLELFQTEYTTLDTITEISKSSNEPEVLLNRRKNAFDQFQSLPYDQDTLFYKYTSFRHFDPRKLDLAGKDPIAAEASKIANLNPHIIETPTDFKVSLPEEILNLGVKFDTLANLYSSDAVLAEKIIKEIDGFTIGFDKLGSLAQALTPRVTVLYIPKNVKIENPIIKLTRIGTGSTATFTEFVVYVEDGAEASILHLNFRESGNKTEQFYATSESVYIGANSSFTSLTIQDWSEDVIHAGSKIAKLGPYAKLKSVTHFQGSQMSRHNSNIILDGKGSEGYDLFLAFGKGDQRFDVKSELHHAGRDTIGQTHARHVMMDKSESILRGLIVIPKTGINADTWLTSQGMTVKKGKVTAVPALKIDQNEVKAAHAASVEPLSEDLVFYLQSRGIPESTAREMLIKGYFEYILKQLQNEELMDVSREFLQAKWTSHNR